MGNDLRQSVLRMLPRNRSGISPTKSRRHTGTAEIVGRSRWPRRQRALTGKQGGRCPCTEDVLVTSEYGGRKAMDDKVVANRWIRQRSSRERAGAGVFTDQAQTAGIVVCMQRMFEMMQVQRRLTQQEPAQQQPRGSAIAQTASGQLKPCTVWVHRMPVVERRRRHASVAPSMRASGGPGHHWTRGARLPDRHVQSQPER